MNAPSMPKPPVPPPVPSYDDARKRQIEAENAAKRQGRAADIFTSVRGDLSPTSLGAKQYLGQ